ncbi:hypothetical protein FH609_028600 [Streptomyces sp. 3MP-14]|uniref:Uncharacterized protein n=1 Tax=Streptomyces mimosae TaxID=2586635 RepID=A0A5N5ZSR7_9ACTN|nr:MULTISPECIES: hypothetical protein [Streptomyces]KAB8159551.1 hypothetical protein FH607_028080 [Streptomyces mimosae]KAB8172829.1 hypothetical protein FH609_028600 [Streptomyces sp. 3MP-14]
MRPPSGRGELVHVEWDEAGANSWTEAADTLATVLARPPAEALAAADRLLAHFPGCAVVAVPVTGNRAWVLGCRSGGALLARPGRAPAEADWRPAVLAYLHARVTSGRPMVEVTVLNVETAAGPVSVELSALRRG